MYIKSEQQSACDVIVWRRGEGGHTILANASVVAVDTPNLHVSCGARKAANLKGKSSPDG